MSYQFVDAVVQCTNAYDRETFDFFYNKKFTEEHNDTEYDSLRDYCENVSEKIQLISKFQYVTDNYEPAFFYVEDFNLNALIAHLVIENDASLHSSYVQNLLRDMSEIQLRSFLLSNSAEYMRVYVTHRLVKETYDLLQKILKS